MSNATTNILAMLIISKRAPEIFYGAEIIRLVGTVVDITLQYIQVILLAFCQHFYERKLVAEVVEDNDILVQYINKVGRIIQRLRLVFNVDIFEVTDSVERCITIQAAIVAVGAGNVERAYELINQVSRCKRFSDRYLCGLAIRVFADTHAMFYTDTSYGMNGNERLGILAPMIVRTLHQGTLGIGIPQFKISADGRYQVAKNLPAGRMVIILRHNQSRLYGKGM